MKFRFLTALILAAVLIAVPVSAQVETGGGGSGSGVKSKGAYNGATAYRAGDLVTYASATYLCIVASPAGTLPTDVTKWTKLGILVGATKLLDVSFGDVTTGDPTRGDLITAQGASPKWGKLAKGTAGTVLTMGANEPAWTAAGNFDTNFRVHTLAAPTAPSATCNAGASGVTVNRYFQITTSDAAGADSLPGAEVSVLACPDDSTITVSWTPAIGAAGVVIYWDATSGAKSHKYVDLAEQPTTATIDFTILTGQPSPNLADDSNNGVTLPVTANARGLFYDFAAGWTWGSVGWFTDFTVANDLWLGAGYSRLRAGPGAPTATCAAGEAYFRSNGAANTTGYLCTAVNTWSPILNTPPTATSQWVWLRAARCDTGSVGTLGADLQLDKTIPAPGGYYCQTGFHQFGAASFTDAAGGQAIVHTFRLPTDWDATKDLIIDATWTSQTHGDITKTAVWQFATACLADGEADATLTWNAATVVLSNAKATTDKVIAFTTGAVDKTGCAAGEMMGIRLLRDKDHADDDLASTAQFIGFGFKLYRQ